MKKIPSNNSQYIRAVNKLEKVKSFYRHLVIYIVVNIAISSIRIWEHMNYRGESFEDAVFDIETFAVWLLWGVGILLHAFSVFAFHHVFGRNWEERKIEKYMNEELNIKK